MSEKKKLDKKELDKVTGGDYGRSWNISTFRQDYATNNVTPNETTNPSDTQFKPEDVGVNSDLLKAG